MGSKKRKRALLESGAPGLGSGSMRFQSSASTGFSAKTSAKGDVVVQEADESGRFIKLLNSSTEKVQDPFCILKILFHL